MIIVLNADKLGYAASFNEKEGDVLTELRQKFMEKYSEDTYGKAAKIIIVGTCFVNMWLLGEFIFSSLP